MAVSRNDHILTFGEVFETSLTSWNSVTLLSMFQCMLCHPSHTLLLRISPRMSNPIMSFASTCIDSLSILSAPWACWAHVNYNFSRSTTTWTQNFWPFWSLGSAKTYSENGPFSHILCSFLRTIRRYIDHPEQSRWNKRFPECLIPECLIVKMSNPKMSNEVLSECQLKKCTTEWVNCVH